MTTPVPPSGIPESGPNSANPTQVSPNIYSGVTVGANDPWYAYAQQMFPNTEITPDIIAGLKKNMMTMINSTIQQVNARQAEAQKYNEQVAKGEE